MFAALALAVLLQQDAPSPAAEAAAAAAAVASGDDAGLRSGTPQDPCEYPVWRDRARCAVQAALAAEAEVRRQDVDCEDAMTQLAMNVCANVRLAWELARMESYFAAASELAYEAAREDLDAARDGVSINPYGSQFLVDLHESQRLWDSYADRVCHSVGEQFHGGSIRPLMTASCYEDLARQRSTALWRHFLAGPEGRSDWIEPKERVTSAEIDTLKASIVADAPPRPAR